MSDFESVIYYEGKSYRNMVLFGNGFFLPLIRYEEVSIEGEPFCMIELVPTKECIERYNIKKDNLIMPYESIIMYYPKDNVFKFFADNRGMRYFVYSGVFNETTEFQTNELFFYELKTLQKQIKDLQDDINKTDEERRKLIIDTFGYIQKNIEWVKQVKQNLILRPEEEGFKEKKPEEF